MKKIIVCSLNICLLISIMLLIASCDESKGMCTIKEIDCPVEDYVITDLNYSSERGLQVAGFEKITNNQITISAWTFENERWQEQYKKLVECEEDRFLESQFYWANGEGFAIPYTWKHVDDKFQEEYYHVFENGTEYRLLNDGFSYVTDMNLIDSENIYWINYEDFLLRKWNGIPNHNPSIVSLNNVKQVMQIDYQGERLYLLGYEGDACIINIPDGKELPPSINLKNCSEYVYENGMSGNQFAFSPYIDNQKKESVFFVDNSGIWRYEDGKKNLLITGREAHFGDETYFTDIAVESNNIIDINYLSIDKGMAISKTMRYEFNF